MSVAQGSSSQLQLELKVPSTAVGSALAVTSSGLTGLTVTSSTSTVASADLTFTLTASVAADVATGTYPVKVFAAAGSAQASADLSLTVTQGQGDLVVSVLAPDMGTATPSVDVTNAGGTKVATLTATGDQTVSHLAPGQYTVAATAVQAGGYTYTPVVHGSPVTVAVAQTAHASVNYGASSGVLAVNVAAPAGVTPVVTVKNAAGTVVKTIGAAGNTLVTDLAPGTYSIAGDTAVANGDTFQASIDVAAPVVAAGQTVRSNVTYVAITGTLSVSVTAPAGVTPHAAVVDGSGATIRDISATGTVTLSGLNPGSYTVTAINVSSGNFTYAPTITGSPATVQAGQTALATVAYGTSTGVIEVTVTAPDGIQPDVVVKDALGAQLQSIQATGTVTIPSLPPGTYSVVSHPVKAWPYDYAVASSATYDVIELQVTAGGTAHAAPSYAAVTGAATVVILVPVVTPAVTPNVVLQDSLGATVQDTFTDVESVVGYLVPGNYTVVAQSVVSNGITYNATIDVNPVAVIAGTAEKTTITYAAAP